MNIRVSSQLRGPIHFFGDSLTDNGNMFELARDLVAAPALEAYVGTGGRLSNGPTYAEYVADLLGLPQGGNHALAGAEAGGSQSLGDLLVELGFKDAMLVPETDPRLALDTNLGGQVDRFGADMASVPLGDATGFIMAGSNDFFNIASPSDAPAVLERAVQGTLSAATDLLALGLGEVVISTLPLPPFFPAFGAMDPVQLDQLNALSAAHSAALAQGVAALQDLGLNLRLLDMRPISEAILEDPSGFGLIAPYGLTLETGAADVLARYDEDQVAFWNPLHPSAATHGILGAYTSFALEDDPVALGSGADRVATGGGCDLVLGLGGGDAILLGRGRDLGFGGSGDDTILAGRGDDLVAGGSQVDVLLGQRGDDVLAGGEGSDRIAGGCGRDVLIDGLGSDRAHGGGGADQFLFIEAELIGGTTGTDTDVFIGGCGRDTLWLVLGASTAAELRDELVCSAPREALAALGIESRGIEEIRIIEDRSGLSALSEEAWYRQADLWGLV